MMMKLPEFDPAGGLSQAITLGTGGVAADANGMFHPVGDHSQTSFVIDGQPISDQQSKVFSTQLPESAIESMAIVTGTPEAEFGDKTSLVAQITTRSGLGATKPFGSVQSNYGSFGSGGGTVTLGLGSAKLGNFISLDGSRSGRFLDSPAFTPFHDVGNNETIFDRLDFQPDARNVFHLNLFTARNWIQIPNDYDQLGQDQRQRVLTWNIAPGYQRTISARTLLTVNPYIRKDQFNYYPSNSPFSDFPATQSSQRQLLNWGVRADVATTQGRHQMKYGMDLKQTRLLENFGSIDFARADLTGDRGAVMRALRPYGIWFGRRAVYLPKLLRPDAASLLALLWSVWQKEDNVPTLPRAGLTSFDSDAPDGFLAAAGFRKFDLNAIQLDAGATVSEIVKLEVGPTTEAISVEAKTVVIQTGESQVSRAVTLRDIDTLPSVGRTALAMAPFAAPGTAVYASDSSYSRINGARQGSNNTTLDGIDANDAVAPRFGLSMTATNTDSLGEVRLARELGDRFRVQYARALAIAAGP